MSGPRTYATGEVSSVSAANRRIEQMFDRWEARQKRITEAQKEMESSKRKKRKGAGK